jgi:hypothetical protein
MIFDVRTHSGINAIYMYFRWKTHTIQQLVTFVSELFHFNDCFFFQGEGENRPPCVTTPIIPASQFKQSSPWH